MIALETLRGIVALGALRDIRGTGFSEGALGALEAKKKGVSLRGSNQIDLNIQSVPSRCPVTWRELDVVDVGPVLDGSQ